MTDSPEIKCNSTQLGLHPLEPLSVEEVKTVVAIVQNSRHLGSQFRFPTAVLNEPPKDVVLKLTPGFQQSSLERK